MKLSSNNKYVFPIEENSGIDSIVLDIGLGIESLSSLPKYYRGHVGYSESPKILEFKTLEEGWHWGEGSSIKNEIIQKTLELDKKAYEFGYFVTDAFPGLDGEIAFTIYYKDDYFEFIVENNGMVTYVHEYKDEEVFCESNIPFNEALEKIELLKEEICSLSEYSILDIGIIGRSDLTALPSKTSVIVSQPYPKNAFYKEDERFASISNTFTQKLPGYLLYIGDSPYRTYKIIT